MQGVPLFGGRPVQETAAFYSRYDAVQMIISAASPLPQAKNQWNLSRSSAFTSRCMAQEWPVEPIFFCIRYMERRVLFSVCNRIIDGDHFRHEYSSTCRAGYFRPIECRRPKVSLTLSGAKMPSLSVQSKFKVTSLPTAV